MNPQVLVADADEYRAAAVVQGLGARYDCRVAGSLAAALDALAGVAWFAVVADFDLDPGFTGIEFLQEVRDRDERILRVLYSSTWSPALEREGRRHAHAHGVLDACSRDFPGPLCSVLDEHADRGEIPRRDCLEAAPDSPVTMWCAVAPVTRRFLEDLRRAAEGDSRVFVHGESGSGKHLAATTLKYWRERWRSEQIEEERHSAAGARTSRAKATGPSGRPTTVVLEVPPLRDRRQDIPHLATAFLRGLSRLEVSETPGLSETAILELLHREWHGNVSELHDVLRRASQRALGKRQIEVSDLPGDRNPPPNVTTVSAKDSGQRKAVLRHLQIAGAVLPAAERARVARPNFMRIMKRLGVLRADTAPDEET